MWLKEKIAPLMHWAAHVSGESEKRIHTTPGARVITYHAVGTPECPTRIFRQQIQFLKKHFDVVSLGVLADNLQSQHPDLHRQVAVTFDDGLRNNLTYAYPILREFRAPATFFVCPGLIDRGCWLWNQEARARLKWMPHAAIGRLAASLGRPGQNHLQIVNWMKKLPTRSRRHIEQIIRDATPMWTPRRAQQIANDLMTWDEIKSLDPGVITIGAHSTNHPILANCTSEELIHEVVECGPLIQKHILKPVRFFCYPNGDYNPLVTRFVEKNYRAATGTRAGIITGEVKMHEIPRLGSTTNMQYFSWRMHRPSA
jgi:peptidoglycan/xylan/chitin deacetylase (PgdA/CDA1 family)